MVGGRGAPTDLVSTPTTTTLAAEVATTQETIVEIPTTTVSADATDDVGQPRAWSEADLMAFPAETLAAEAAALAEWLASDFFTIDGGTQIADDLEKVLPARLGASYRPFGIPVICRMGTRRSRSRNQRRASTRFWSSCADWRRRTARAIGGSRRSEW